MLWRREIDGPGDDPLVGVFDVTTSVAVDAAGNVVAGGGLVGTSGESPTVVKLAGADGAVLWQHDVDSASGGFVREVAIDAAGDVLIAGQLFVGSDRFIVAKLSGATGDELWRYETPGDGRRIVLDAAGNAVATGDAYVLPPPGGAGSFRSTFWWSSSRRRPARHCGAPT